jgi:hypothetical protein
MKRLVARYVKVAGLADQPTLVSRLVAAVIAGSAAFLLTYFLLGIAWGAGSAILVFCAVGFAIAAAVGAATAKLGMAITYGFLGALWLLAEAIVGVLGAVIAGLG